MKRIALIMGIVAIALASCTKDTVKEINSGRAIDFRVAAQTRAIDVTTTNLREFYVTALPEDGLNYFTDVFFTKDDESEYFTSTPAYYWPNSTSLAFYAYAPSASDLGGTLSITNSGQTLSGFAPMTDIADQVDFIFARATGNKNSNESFGVDLQFGHMLSQIQINAKNAHSDYIYSVAGVRISGVVSKADFDFGSSTWTLSTKSEDKATYVAIHDKDVILDADGKIIMNTLTLDGENVSDNAMLIPQDLSASGMDARLGIYVNVKATNGSQVFPESLSETYGWMETPIQTNWEPGFKYVYKLDLTSGSFLGEPIKFTVDVTPWGEKINAASYVGNWQLTSILYTEYKYNGNKLQEEYLDIEEADWQTLTFTEDKVSFNSITEEYVEIQENYFVKGGGTCYIEDITATTLIIRQVFLFDDSYTEIKALYTKIN